MYFARSGTGQSLSLRDVAQARERPRRRSTGSRLVAEEEMHPSETRVGDVDEFLRTLECSRDGLADLVRFWVTGLDMPIGSGMAMLDDRVACGAQGGEGLVHSHCAVVCGGESPASEGKRFAAAVGELLDRKISCRTAVQPCSS